MQRSFRLPSQRQAAPGCKVGLSWIRLTGFVLAAAAVCASAGCETSSFIPPPPEELRAAGEDRAPAANNIPRLDGSDTVANASKRIELILERHDPEESESLKASARMQAGFDRARINIESLNEQDLPARQAELVRDAVARGPLALIVEPADPSDVRLAEGLKDAHAKGVPVVLLNRPLAGGRAIFSSISDHKTETSSGSATPPASKAESTPDGRPAAPIVLVAPVSFVPAANQLVGSAVRNAKNAGLDPKGGAVVLINSNCDSFVEDRAAAFRSALRSNYIDPAEEVRFSKDVELGSKLLVERLKANPKLTMVLSVDSVSAGASRNAMTAIVADRPFVLAAFAAEETYAEMTQVGDFAAVAEFAPLRVVRKAVTTAISLAQGASCQAGSRFRSP